MIAMASRIPVANVQSLKPTDFLLATRKLENILPAAAIQPIMFNIMSIPHLLF